MRSELEEAAGGGKKCTTLKVARKFGEIGACNENREQAI
jgi:hypothetical protein